MLNNTNQLFSYKSTINNYNNNKKALLTDDKQSLDYWVRPKIATDRAKFDPQTIISLLSVVKFEGKPSLHYMASVWSPFSLKLTNKQSLIHNSLYFNEI